MATLFFTPRTTIDANVFQNRLDNSPYHGEWNVRTGAYEFEIEESFPKKPIKVGIGHMLK